MKKQVVHVSVLQSAKVMAALYLVFSLPMVLVMAIPALMTGGEGVSMAMLIFAPILYTVVGFIFTALGAWIYNLVAARIGGFEFTTSEVSK
jgi:hypothetical protein